MSKKSLRSIFENIATGASGAGSIAGFRAALFVGNVNRPTPPIDAITMSPYATTPNPLNRKKPKMKVKGTTLKENKDFDTVTTSALRDLLRQKQRDSELRDTSEVFALEDNDGAVVKVYVKKDQAEDFKHAIETILADEEDQGKEIAEILFDLHKGFDIVSVDWGKGSIPEDEEQIANSEDAEAQGFPGSDELGDVDAEMQGTPDEASSTDGGGLDGVEPDLDAATNAGIDQATMLNQIIGLLQAQADAQRAQADAAKAQADVQAAEAAGKAAAQYASYQEEVMDMENYNKRQQEERRENQIQAKLIRYRHDLRKEESKTLDDKLNDPEYLLNTLHKASIGESVTATKYTPATPEEEEVLKMEDWEKAEKAKKKDEQIRDRLVRYRHANKANEPTGGTEAPAADAQVDSEAKKFDPKSGRLMDYLLRLKDAQKAGEHNAAQQ